jgi:uncharacterized protein (DUF779 family)
MKVDVTDAARTVVERALAERTGTLTITIANGCCESTAPFLYEDYWPGPDAEAVGEVAGVVIYAPGHLRKLYPGGQGATIDVVDVNAESMSLETAWGQRFILRGHGLDTGNEATSCEAPPRLAPSFDPTDPDRPGARVRGELPEALRHLRSARTQSWTAPTHP